MKARLSKVEVEISEKENLLNDLNERMNDSETASNYEKMLELTNRIDEEQRTLESLYSEWEELSEYF